MTRREENKNQKTAAIHAFGNADLYRGRTNATVTANATAIVVPSMALTPLVVLMHGRFGPRPATSMEDVEAAQDQGASVLVICFGRVGKIASQGVVSRGASPTVIDNGTQDVREARRYLVFQINFGDGVRVDPNTDLTKASELECDRCRARPAPLRL